MRSNAASAAPATNGPGVVGGDDPLAGGDAGRGVAARRARDPVVEVARGQRDVARRAGRAARRVDADDLVARPRTGARRSGSRRVDGRAQLLLLGQRQRARSRRARRPRRPSRARRGRASRGRRPSARTGRRAARGRRRRRSRAAPPTAASRPRARASLPRSAPAVRRPPPRPPPPSGSRSAPRCSSARWASRPAVRARIGIAFTASRREAEVEHHGRDRHRDVHRQRPAPGLGGRVAEARARAPRAARSRRARRRARGCARRAGRAAGGRDGRSPAAGPPARGPRARAPGDAPPARRPRPPRRAASSSRAHSSAVPRITGPQPRIPAATAPCSEPGSAASVIRAATFVGIIPCSAIATSSRSRKKRCSSVGSSPVSSRWKYSVKVSRPIRSPVRSRPRTSTRSG